MFDKIKWKVNWKMKVTQSQKIILLNHEYLIKLSVEVVEKYKII